MMNPRMMFVEYRISMIFLLLFLLLFLPLRYKGWVSAVAAAGCFAATWIPDYLMFSEGASDGLKLLCTLLEIVIVQLTAFVLCRYRDARALFTGIMAAMYVLTGNVLYAGLMAVYGFSFSILFVVTAVHLILLLVLTVLVRSDYLREIEHPSPYWKLFCAIPAMFYVVFYSLICWPGDIYQNRENWVTALLLLILMEMTYMLIFKMILQQRLKNELEQNQKFLARFAEGLRREAELQRSSEERLRIVRHDSRHVYQMIRSYLQDGKTEKISELLEQVEQELRMSSGHRFCENAAVNGIILGSEVRAKQEEIEFVCNADVPEDLKAIDEFEFAVVVSNLLENALNAASEVEEPEKRKVMIRIFPVKGQLVLEITNTFQGSRRFSESTGLPLSEKGADHGYGFRSVQAYANKHQSVLLCSVENGLFCVRLLTEM